MCLAMFPGFDLFTNKPAKKISTEVVLLAYTSGLTQQTSWTYSDFREKAQSFLLLGMILALGFLFLFFINAFYQVEEFPFYS